MTRWDAPNRSTAQRWRLPLTTPTLLSHLRLSPKGTIRVAVVGNGPLFESDRHKIERYENIVRFNDMKTWRRNETVTLHAARAERDRHDFWTSCVRQSGHQNRTMWALAAEHKYVPADVDLVSWTFWEKQHNENWQWWGRMPTEPQVLEPYKESLYLFPSCSACVGQLQSRCLFQNAKYGPSAGALVINALEALPEVDEIAVFGMNWRNAHPGDHTDFKYSAMIPTCCTKCTAHPTPTGNYYARGCSGRSWVEHAASSLRSAAAAVDVAATAGFAWAIAAAIGIKHLLHRRRSKKELADAVAVASRTQAHTDEANTDEANTDAQVGTHTPLLRTE